MRQRGRVLGYSIRTPRYRYTEWKDGELGVELYDYKEDPQEYTNLAASPAHQTIVEEMKRLLAEARKKASS